jgi:hypothetical protein
VGNAGRPYASKISGLNPDQFRFDWCNKSPPSSFH